MELKPFYDGGQNGRLLEYNPYHGPGGKFASKGNAVQTVAYGGKSRSGLSPSKAGKLAGKSWNKDAVANRGSARLAQDAAAKGRGNGASDDAVGRSVALRQSGLPKRKAIAAAKAGINAARAERGQKRAYKTAPKKGDLLLGRETVPQTAKHTKRTSSGERPSKAERFGMSIRRRGQKPRLEQDTRDRHAMGQAAPRTRSAMSKREAVPQNDKKYTKALRVGKKSSSTPLGQLKQFEASGAKFYGSKRLMQDQSVSGYNAKSAKARKAQSASTTLRLKRGGS